MVNNDLGDEMVDPAPDNSDAAPEDHESDSSENDDPLLLKTCCSSVADALPANGAPVEIKPEAERLASTSLYCSLPLSRDVQSIIDTFPKSTDPERKKTRKLPCLYCERTFVADGLRQKHVERCHSAKQARRSSSRFQQGAAGVGTTVTLQCQFCDAFQPAAGGDDLSDLFCHLHGEHADRYFACVACRERFVLKMHLDEHREEEHGAVKREHMDVADEAISVDTSAVALKAKGAATHKSKTKDCKEESNESATDSNGVKAAKEEKVVFEQKELRSKKSPMKSTKLGTKRSARLQNKETPQANKHSSASSTTSSSSSTSSKKKGKTKDVPAEAADRETLKVATHENPYPAFDAFYRIKKITDHSIDNLRITSLTFNDVFDQAFYTRVKCNIADNLQNHIDGKLFKNEESESRISNFEKAQAELSPTENNFGCEISLHAATPVASFLAPQLGDDPEAQIEYGSKASKKKTKPDEVHYKYFTRRKYQASIQEIKENRDLSKLDMWTQYVVKNRQQAVANTTRSEKEKQDYKRGEEYRAKLQNEELNRILDRRGPFEDLKLEANKQAVLDGNMFREARVEASCILEEVLLRVFDLIQPEVCASGAKTELTDAEIPGYLNLRRASSTEEAHVDRSDKITLICSSEETENFEAPQVSPRDKHALVELSGEWTRSRLFICAACGTRLANMRALIDHKNSVHQNVWCQHYEFVGKQGAYYKHLSIPGLGKMQVVEGSPAVKSWLRSTARQCTKCKKVCNTLGELHRHILECGEDWSWMLIRKKCKYRPYGAKTRRKRRGLIKRHETSKKETKEKKTYKRTDRPREKPSDAETIQRMLANLPAKRATRKEMSLKDGFPKASRKVDPKGSKTKKLPQSRTEQLLQETSTIVKRKVLVANKCNPVSNLRKSVRNLNKVISSSLIDNNIVVRRKYKALQAKRAPRAYSTAELPERPVDLTEEQRAEEVKKKISLFKKVQKFRQSVIKKRTTKASTSSADSVEKLAPEAGASVSGSNAAENWRKTRSASNLIDNSSGSDRRAHSPSKKKLRANFGAKLIRTLSMRRRNKNTDDELASSSSTSSGAAPEEKRKRFAGIKEVIKKLKVTNQNKKSNKKQANVVQTEAAYESVPSNEHFLEESNRESTTRTISDSLGLDKRDNDNRPSAIAPPLNSLSDKPSKQGNNITESQLQDMPDDAVHENSNCDKGRAAPSAPIVTITLADNDTDKQDNRSHSGNALQSVPLITTVKALTEILSLNIKAAPLTSERIPSTDGSTPVSEQLASPPILPSLSPLLGKSKGKLCKRAKGLNDCIAMLTSKLQCKSDTAETRQMHSPTTTIKETPMVIQVQQQPESPVVVVTPHDTTTEEQNVVIPEDTVSENLESAKEPEAAPPSPLPIKTIPSAAPTQTTITISDISAPVIEQEKDNFEMEEKSLIPANKQVFDATLEKVVDLIKCLEEIHPKDILNGHLDHTKADVVNGFKGLSKKPTKQTVRKIGSIRRTPKRSDRTTFVHEPLNISRLEDGDFILDDLERKIGSKRSLPQRKTKNAFVDLKIPKIKLKDRNQPKSVPTSNLPTILEESHLIDDLPFMSDKGATLSQVLSNAPQTSALVHVVHSNQLPTHIPVEKDELPVDLSLTRKPDIAIEVDVPVDLSTKKTVSDEVIVLSTKKEDFIMEVPEKQVPHEATAAEPVKTSASTAGELLESMQNHVENEATILESKAIPHRTPPRNESLSESEDELPLATLMKTIAPSSTIRKSSIVAECLEPVKGKKRDAKITPPEAIVTPADAKAEIQQAFLKKVKKSISDIPNKIVRKRKSEVASLHAYFNPILDSIVISDEESVLELDSLTSKPDNEVNQEKSVVSKSSPGMERINQHFLQPMETLVCTPDLTLLSETSAQKQSLQSMMCSPIIEPIDFEDVIPVVSISPSEAVKYKRNRNASKSKSGTLNEAEKNETLFNEESFIATNENDITAFARSKKGRKSITNLQVEHFKVNDLPVSDVVEQLSIREDASFPVDKQREEHERLTKSVELLREPSGELENCKLDEETARDEYAATVAYQSEEVTPLKTSFANVRNRKGRTKSKRGRKPKINKTIGMEAIITEENVPLSSHDTIITLDAVGSTETAKDLPPVDESIYTETEKSHEPPMILQDSPRDDDKINDISAIISEEKEMFYLPPPLCEPQAELLNGTADNLDTSLKLGESPREKKSKSKMRKGKKRVIPDRNVDKSADLEMEPFNEMVSSETSTSTVICSPKAATFSNEGYSSALGKDDESLNRTAKKIGKSKRGRRPKPVKTALTLNVDPGSTVDENIADAPHESILQLSPIESTLEISKTRSRKRKSDEVDSSPVVIEQVEDVTNSVDVAPPTTTPSQVQYESEPKKSIAIYDFDEEDDECTGDNSKENMEHLKSKPCKRSRRNGHSPSKTQIYENEDNVDFIKPIKSLANEVQENIQDEFTTPLKDVQNESFIHTPDLNDSVLASKIASRFKVRKGKSSKAKKIPAENIQEHYCEICNKQFGRLDSLNKHKRTLTHIAKLSEIEALEAEAKKKQNELKAEEEKDRLNTIEAVCDVDEIIIAPPEEEKLNQIFVNDDIKEVDEKAHESKILSPTSEFMRSQSHPDATKSILITSPFSLRTNNDSLRLADIISDVLNKPVEGIDDYTEMDKQSQLEPKRYKSLGERKSFDSDSAAYTTPTYNISPASTLINKTSDEFLKKQLSLLENIIEENKASFEYMDDASVQSIGSEKSDRCPSDMSLVSDIKEDSSRIISYNDESNFVKPNAQYEEISEDSMNNRNYEQDRSRKTLNRDEELFLECCSLLKSSSEVSDSKKSRAQEVPISNYNARNRTHEINECSKQNTQSGRKLIINEDDFMSDSCSNTAIGDTYDDFSNSDTIKTDWTSKINDKEYDDISQSSAGQDSAREGSSFKAFSFKLDSKSDIDDSSNSVDFRKNINAKFVGLMAEAMKGKSPRRKKKERRKSGTTQTSIIDYAVQLTPKSSSNSADNFTDLTNDSKKVMTKGAMKVFEGLKVSIPTDEIDMNQVLDCSPTSKRLEIEESAKIIGKAKGLNFGNKLGLKVTKKRVARNRKPEEFLAECDKIYDVYDFEETQDNTDLFSPISKLTFRNGNNGIDVSAANKEIMPAKKAKLTNDTMESESESNNQDLDLFGAEIQSVNSFSTETESSTSIKPSMVATTQENITKKKCQIMGRIFKNAFKTKTDGTKENAPVDDGDALENYIIGGPLEEIATPPTEKSPPSKDRPKMSEKEMDLLFDKLLQGKDDEQPLKVNRKIPSNVSTPLVSPVEKAVDTKEPEYHNEHLVTELKELKDLKGKKMTPKSVKACRRRSRKHSEYSDDEFNLSKAPKKRQIRKSKPRDNGINLDEEMKECMGVAGRKSQRKCTSGKQNVLVEYWSSDDSEFEAMLRLSMQESGGPEKPKEERLPKVKSASAETKSILDDEAKVDPNSSRQDNKVEITGEPPIQRNDSIDDLIEARSAEPPSTTINATPKTKAKRCNNSTSKSRSASRENKMPRAPKAKHSRAPQFRQDEDTLAANRRKRAAVDTLYYWSSSSEDDTQNLIEVKSLRDEIDDEEDRPQHGWIVGDSPKKLVTLLAHAKGKKSNR